MSPRALSNAAQTGGKEVSSTVSITTAKLPRALSNSAVVVTKVNNTDPRTNGTIAYTFSIGIDSAEVSLFRVIGKTLPPLLLRQRMMAPMWLRRAAKAPQRLAHPAPSPISPPPPSLLPPAVDIQQGPLPTAPLLPGLVVHRRQRPRQRRPRPVPPGELDAHRERRVPERPRDPLRRRAGEREIERCAAPLTGAPTHRGCSSSPR